MRKNKFPIFKFIFIITIIIIFVTLYLLGFRITYAPNLANNWDAIAAVGAFIGSILTGIAIFVAINANKTAKIANKISRESLDEMIRQKEQDDRPYIVISLEHIRRIVCFVITNEGVKSAQNVKLRFNDEFINAVEGNYKRGVDAINKSVIHIAPKQKIFIRFASFGNKVIKEGIIINIAYEYEGYKETYNDEIAFDLKNYYWIVNNDDSLDKIAKSLDGFSFQNYQRDLHNDFNEIIKILKNNNDSEENNDDWYDG